MISVSPTGWPSKRSTASRFAPPRFDVRDERGERGPQPRLVRLAQRHERAAAALDEERRLAAEQDDVRAGDARRARARALRPRAAQRRTAAPDRPPRARARSGSSPSCGRSSRSRSTAPRQRELRAAEPLDEVAAAADAERLEVAQLAVDRAVAAGDSFAAHAVARDDPLPLEQELGERAPLGTVRGRDATASDQRPCVDVMFALRVPREAARPARCRSCVA